MLTNRILFPLGPWGSIFPIERWSHREYCSLMTDPGHFGGVLQQGPLPSFLEGPGSASLQRLPATVSLSAGSLGPTPSSSLCRGSWGIRPKGVPNQGPEYQRPRGLQQEERDEQATFFLPAPSDSCWGSEEVGEEWKLQHSLRPCAA